MIWPSCLQTGLTRTALRISFPSFEAEVVTEIIQMPFSSRQIIGLLLWIRFPAVCLPITRRTWMASCCNCPMWPKSHHHLLPGCHQMSYHPMWQISWQSPGHLLSWICLKKTLLFIWPAILSERLWRNFHVRNVNLSGVRLARLLENNSAF